MKLSKRLELVASFVREGSNLADIGTDHGYIPIALVEQKTVPRAIAMDVKRGPLERAGRHIRMHGLESRIETRLSDGTEKLKPGEADTVVIAGMGGELVIHIMTGGRRLWDSVSQWVLSPQSDLEKVRRFLGEQGFFISREAMVEEDGKYYTVMDVSRGEMGKMSQAGYVYGASLIRDKDPVLMEFLMREKRQILKIREQLEAQTTQAARERMTELFRKLRVIEEAEHEMQ